MTLWFDVEDLIRYFQQAARPTGIQRLSFETYRALWQAAGEAGEVRFCRRNAARTGFRSLHFPALEAGILTAAALTQTTPALPQQNPPSFLGRHARRLPLRYRLPLGRLMGAALTARAAAGDLAAAILSPWRAQPAASSIGGHQFDLAGPDIAFAPGDWLANLGASWEEPYSPQCIATLRAQGGRLALLAHDLIPALFPEWCTARMITDFAAWLAHSIPQADATFAVSCHTAADLTACMQALGHTIPPPIVLPVGSHPPAARPRPAILQTPYILMVGTIEARKNHAAMLRVWRNLLQTLPAADVPTLVIAGKFGWLTQDFRQQLDNANWLNGKICWFQNPSDSTLANLYQNCLFTVFPSLYEGWGLPVTESLCHGKAVAASNRAAIPEAGRNFCAYFDPDNISDITATLRTLIECPAQLAQLESRIAEQFHPPSWHDTAAALLRHLATTAAQADAPQATPGPGLTSAS
jgi:glycosyltransferase involved in cell wall biosynthesis